MGLRGSRGGQPEVEPPYVAPRVSVDSEVEVAVRIQRADHMGPMEEK